MMREYAEEGNYIERIYMEKALPYFSNLFKEGRETSYMNKNLSDEAIFFFIQMLKDSLQKEDHYAKALPLTEDIMNIFFYGIMGKSEE
ncbi:hypothetical protein [Niallia sp. 03133]|uniref:hypothetical protein n=1 Tax=Niallia sp. 03133 TaxID=3458060 RepID=UPI004044D634